MKTQLADRGRIRYLRPCGRSAGRDGGSRRTPGGFAGQPGSCQRADTAPRGRRGETPAAGRLLASDFEQIDVTGSPETRADVLANIGGGLDFVTLGPTSPVAVRMHGNTAAVRLGLAFKVLASVRRSNPFAARIAAEARPDVGDEWTHIRRSPSPRACESAATWNP
jgi:hypothetical protein